jgi:hypothetical protein
MVIYLIAVALLITWAVGMLFHKGGFLHMVLLAAVCLIVVQLVAGRRAV